MDYIAGGELFTYLRTEGKLEPEHAMQYSAQVCLMFEYLHSKNIIYRDLKPENILVEKDPRTEEVIRVKVADFGLSKILVPDEDMIESCGTPAYVAPEVLHRKGYRKEVDMWSAGVIFYTLVCRQLPF